MTDTASDPALTAARQIEEANVANILAKLGAGKILSKTEETRLKDFQSAQARAATQGNARVADSMTAAAALSGLSEKDLGRAKSAGCPAFRGSRVYVDELLPWWDENYETLPTGDDELDAISRDIAREKLRKVRFENEVAAGRYIEAARINDTVETLAGKTLTILRRVLEDEAPRRLQGKTEEDLRALMGDITDEICHAVREEIQTWSHSQKAG